VEPGVLWWLAATPVLATLLLFSARRILLTTTLWRRQPPLPTGDDSPDVLVLVPVRDDVASLPDLVEALDKLDYPRSRLRVVLVDDGSVDAGADLMPRMTASRPGWHALSIDRAVGKAEALNLALATHPFGDIVYVFDADHRPRSDCLRLAARAFADPQVAGVNGRMLITNPCASAATFYVAMESLIHQMITVRGKDVLGLSPPLLGSNTGYRRATLEGAGGYRRGALLEDGDLTLLLSRTGHRTRFVPDAVSRHAAPPSLRGYLEQHIRWGRGFNDIAGSHVPQLLRDRRLPLLHRLELVMFALGYLDRLAVMAAVAMVAVPPLRPVMLAALGLTFALPVLQATCVLVHERAAFAMWWRLPLLVPLFVLDMAAAITATLLSLTRRDPRWRPTERG
jgi:cellulose synthase/poly-beta-1,6-N-acetylglucosamine synthase-like glycosyltransferase